MSNKADPTRAILYSVAGGVLTAMFGVLGATDAHAEPRDTAGQPPAKDPNPKKVESPVGRLTGPTPERARQQAADVRKARESRPAENRKTTKVVKTEKRTTPTVVRKVGRSSDEDKKTESPPGRLTGPTPQRARQQAADVRKARESRPAENKQDGGRGAGGGARELIKDLTSAGSRPEPTDRFPLDLSRRDSDDKKTETLEQRVARTSPSPQRSRQQSADARQAKKERAQKTKGGAGESPALARLPDHLRDVLTAEPKSDNGDRFPGMVSNAVVTDRGRSDGGSTASRSGVRENLDDLLTAGRTRGRSDEFPGMASRTPSRPRAAQPPEAAKDPDDHWVGNVADEARETIVEGLEAIPAAIGSFVQANQDATTWSEADPNSDEWRAADKRIKERGEAVAEVVRNPGKVVDEVIRPYKEDWNSDKPERVIGRAAVDIGTMFIPGVGVGKRVLNAAEALPGGRGPELDTNARPRPDQQTPPDRAGSAPPAGTQNTAAPETTSRSPNNGDRRGSRVLPNPVTQLPTLPHANRGEAPARPSARDRRDTGTPRSRTSDDDESRQRPSDRTPETGTSTSPKAREATEAATRCAARNSFVPGTPVLLADGSYKPIEQVRLGDQVLATDPVTGLTQSRPVLGLIPGQGLKELVRITVDTDGDRGDATGTVTATDEHPFWVADTGRWTDAEDLDRGNLLRAPDGRLLEVVAVREWTQRQQVHNLTVEGLHTYYVLAGGAPVLVHNSSCPTLDLDRASGSGRKPDPKDARGEFELAGNALAKHAGRKTNIGQWPIPSGKQNPAAWNALGREVLDEILTHPGAVISRGYGRINGVFQETIDIRLPNGGRGARFSASGEFSGFLD
ncbi:polymorphic toxin-type HINT domain-containing protein [Amycolatopsis japonica]|uniref:polymorphic toxin-type HINT domain-containing protein n=1 Tax=Amycolatopsis japonica TaxID=208439 RepID=UPI00366C20BD